jgi:hypothetical protein
MSLRIYVAGAFCDKAAVRRVQDALRAAGHTITLDWTWHEDGTKDAAALAADAAADVDGVARADAALFLFTQPTYAYRGTFTELGVALGMAAAGAKQRLVIVDALPASTAAYYRTNCFFHHGAVKPADRFDSVAAALASFGA